MMDGMKVVWIIYCTRQHMMCVVLKEYTKLYAWVEKQWQG